MTDSFLFRANSEVCNLQPTRDNVVRVYHFFGTPEFTSTFLWCLYFSIFSFIMFCRSWFVLFLLATVLYVLLRFTVSDSPLWCFETFLKHFFYFCVLILMQINYKQKNDKASDTTHSKIRIETLKSKLFNLKTKRMLKIAIMLTCYERQKKINSSPLLFCGVYISQSSVL
jgi:hypothetical protein